MAKDRFRGFMVFLGLAEDDYDDFGRGTGVERPVLESRSYEAPEPQWTPAPAPTLPPPLPPRVEPVRSDLTRPMAAVTRSEPLARVGSDRPLVRPLGSPSVRPITTLANDNDIVIFQPGSYNESSKIVDQLKSRHPIVINLVGVEHDLSRRVLDFTSGAVYSLSGSIKKIASEVYLAIPQNFHVSPETFDRLRRQFAPVRGL